MVGSANGGGEGGNGGVTVRIQTMVGKQGETHTGAEVRIANAANREPAI